MKRIRSDASSVDEPLTSDTGPDGEHTDPNTISPLPGEPGIPDVAVRSTASVSKKGLLAVALLVLSLVAVCALSVQRMFAGKSPEADQKLARDRPSAAAAEPRRLDLTALPPSNAASGPQLRIPALQPEPNGPVEPIGVRRTGDGVATPPAGQRLAPEDAPVLLVSTRPAPRSNTSPPSANPSPYGTASTGLAASDDPVASTTQHLEGYQRQLQSLLDTLTRSVESSATPSGNQPPTTALLNSTPAAPAQAQQSGNGLFGGQLQASATPRTSATLLGDRSLLLSKGTAFTCALKTKVISATSGLVGCQVQGNVYSDDGRVLLIERGSHIDGEYRSSSVRPGTVRIPVLWTRIRTPLGVSVDLDSPGTGQLGESGIDGHVDNRWTERIGAAMLLSLIDDSVKLVIQQQSNDSGGTVVLPSTTSNTSKLAEKVLDSTINIPPLIYQNQGGVVGIYVARDVDFSSVYELRPVTP